MGLTPHSLSKLGGYKVRGTDAATARRLTDDALALEAAGAFVLDLECVPDRLSEIIAKKLSIPIYGIGCGLYTDGQFLVLNDSAGLFERFTAKFVKKYGNVAQEVLKMIQQYKDEVEQGVFPDSGIVSTFKMKS